MRAWAEAVTLSGSTLRVAAPDPLPAERDTLAVATGIGVLGRGGGCDRGGRSSHDGEGSLTRLEVGQRRAEDGLGALRDRRKWPRVLARAVQRHWAKGAGGDA